jgi:arylsulfatase A-like enzyme/tetratricopeptide (TPR) repeat protein
VHLIVSLTAVAGLVWSGCSKNDEAADTPIDISAEGHNIILVTMDTTRTDFLGCYGAANASTPHLDRLANEGVRLTRCSTCVSLTLPSHASILTGYYPFVHGIRNNGTRRLADSFQTLAEILKAAGYATGAEIASAVLDARYGLDQGFDTYHDVPTSGAGGVYPQRRGDDVCDAAILQLKELAPGPFFLWVHFYDPHDPYDAPGYVGGPGRGAYAAEVTYMDSQIGRLIDAIEGLGIQKKTLVALVSDHGEGLADHSEGGHGYFVYQTTVDVPFILWGPGTLPAGKTIDCVTRTVDAFPTLLELVGLRGPDNTHGVSLVPLLEGRQATLAGTAYAESLTGYLRFRSLAPLRSLRAEDRKYVLAPTPGLFDLQADPDELHNVIREQASLAEGLHAQLRSLIEDAPAPPQPGDSTVTLTDEARGELAALGYTGGAGGEDIRREIDIFEPQGEDPRSHIENINLDNSAMTAFGEGRFAAAEPLLRRVVDAFPGSALVRLDLTNVLTRMNRLPEACEQMARAVELDPESDELRVMYAELLIKAERWDEAEAQLTTLAEDREDDPVLLRNLGLVRVGQDRLAEANALFEQAAALDPDSAKPVRGTVLVLFKQERYAEAESLLEEALKANSSDAMLRTDLGYAMEKQGRIEEAIRTYRAAMEADPGAVGPRQYLARLLGEQHRWAEALELHDQLVEQAPHDADRLCGRAHCLTRLKRHGDAAADFENACRLDPANRVARRGLALARIQSGQAAKAVEDLEAAAADRPDDPGLLGLLAYATQQAGDLPKAEGLYAQALARAPDRADLRAWHGGLLLLQERTDEAAAEFERAIAIDPNELDARYSLGQILGRRGQLEAARGHFEHILQIEPGHVRALHALGVLCARQQKWADAARFFERALASNPNHAASRRDLQRVRERMRQGNSP